MTWILLTLSAFYGGVLGGAVASFCGVVAERVPQGQGVGGRSRCACGRQLRWWENVPVAGWLVGGGVARCCRTLIPVRYVLTETLSAAVVAAVAAVSVSRVGTGGGWTSAAVAVGGASVTCGLLVLVLTWQHAPRPRA